MIQFNNVNFSYQDATTTPNLEKIDLSINKGDFVLLCGPSGSGKTAILRLINGLVPNFYKGEFSGKLLINQNSHFERSLQQTSKIVGTVFQNPRSQFFCTNTTNELVFGCENQNINPVEIESRLQQTVIDLNLSPLMNRNIFKLSGGEKQKIACGAVSVTKNTIYVLDEPSSNLDVMAINDLRLQLKLWKSQGQTIVIAEHRLCYLKDLIDRVIYLNNGQIEKEYTAESFINLPASTLRALGLRTLSLKSTKMKIKEKSTSQEFINIKSLTFSYPKSKKNTLDINSLLIPKGSVIAIIGHNGAGKTTFARCFCGLEKHSNSEIFNEKTQMNKKQRLKKSYLVMQDVNHQLFTESVLDEVLLSMDQPNESNALNLLDKLGISDLSDSHPLALSGGQKQRVAIASALASDCDFLFFDEPTSGLDLKSMENFAECIKLLSELGKTIFLITHDLELISNCSSHILKLNQGKNIEFYSLTKENFENTKNFFIKNPVGEIDESKK